MVLTVAVRRAFALDSPLTLPKTRAFLWRLMQTRAARVVFWWAVCIALLNGIWANVRGLADEAGFAVQGAEWERAVFGGLPGQWLQENVHGLSPSLVEWSCVVIYTSWLIVPNLLALVVSFRRPERLGSFFMWWFGLYYVCLISFVFFPLAPPWMADPETQRLASLAVGDIDDINQVAAMPSLHVALPLLMGIWFLRERWRWPGIGMFAYAALISLEVVVSGEHYIIDVIAGVLVALAVAAVASGAVGKIPEFVKGRSAALIDWRERRRAVAVQAGSGERGQAVIELAVALPFMLVVLLVLVDGGLAIDNRIVLQHSVRGGARVASVGTSEAGVDARVVDQSQGLLDADDVTVCYIDGPDGNSSVGDVTDTVRVEASYTHSFGIASGELLTGLGLSPPSINMSPSAEFLLEAAVGGATECS
jgi:hypothetical protein